MSSVTVSARAQSDLLRFHTFLATENVPAADAAIDALLQPLYNSAIIRGWTGA